MKTKIHETVGAWDQRGGSRGQRSCKGTRSTLPMGIFIFIAAIFHGKKKKTPASYIPRSLTWPKPTSLFRLSILHIIERVLFSAPCSFSPLLPPYLHRRINHLHIIIVIIIPFPTSLSHFALFFAASASLLVASSSRAVSTAPEGR